MVIRNTLCFLIIIFLCLGSIQSHGQGSNAEQDQLLAYFKDFNNTLYGLIQVSKKGNTKLTNQSTSTAPLYRLISINCQVFEEIDPNIPFERAELKVDMTFQKVDESGIYAQLQDQDISFWIDRTCIRQELQARDDGSKRQWSTLAENIYKKHKKEYIAFNRFKKKLSKRSDFVQFQSEINKIEAKHKLIEQIYSKLNLGPTEVDNLAFLQKIKVNGQLLFGNSSFNTNFTDLRETQNSSENIDVQLNATYSINSESKVLFNIKNRKETLITPYNNWNVGAGYDLKYAGHQFSFGSNYESYKDDFQQINDYGKISFNALVRKIEASSFNYIINYRFLDQSFDQLDQNSYSRHQTIFRFDVKANSTFSFQPGLIYNLGKSDNALFEYSFVNPSLTLSFDRPQETDQLYLNYENTSFSNLDLRNNSRFHLEWVARKNLDNRRSKRNQFGVIYRMFPGADQSDYLDVYSKLQSRKDQFSKRFMVRYRHFPNIEKNDRLDIRQGLEQGGPFYLGYDFNIRLQYPTDETFFSRLDGYFKIGRDFSGILIGPYFRWHLIVDFKNIDLGIIDRDQNSYQYGVESSGYFKIAKKGRLRYRAAYDLNTVFSRALDPTDPTMALDAESRHPSNFQFDLDLGVKVTRYLEVFAVANYFDHKTDFEEDINTNFIMDNTGNRFKLGVRVNYN